MALYSKLVGMEKDVRKVKEWTPDRLHGRKCYNNTAAPVRSRDVALQEYVSAARSFFLCAGYPLYDFSA